MSPIVVDDKATIETIQDILSYHKYPSQFYPIQPDSPYRQLLVGPGRYRISADSFDSDRQIVINVMFLNDVLLATQQQEYPHSDTLQFIINLPFKVPAEKLSSVLRVMTVFNNFIPLGCFNMNVDGAPYYRYAWKIYERNVDGLLLLEILDEILFFVERLGYKLEEVATAKKTVKEILEEEIDFGQKLNQSQA